MSVVIDDVVLHKIHLSEAQLLTEIAVMLFQQERFTLEQASRFARMNQLQFQRLLASRQISLHVSSTAAQTLISRRVENASNPHDCVPVFPNSELRTPNSELTFSPLRHK